MFVFNSFSWGVDIYKYRSFIVQLYEVNYHFKLFHI